MAQTHTQWLKWLHRAHNSMPHLQCVHRHFSRKMLGVVRRALPPVGLSPRALQTVPCPKGCPCLAQPASQEGQRGPDCISPRPCGHLGLGCHQSQSVEPGPSHPPRCCQPSRRGNGPTPSPVQLVKSSSPAECSQNDPALEESLTKKQHSMPNQITAECSCLHPWQIFQPVDAHVDFQAGFLMEERLHYQAVCLCRCLVVPSRKLLISLAKFRQI